MRSDFVFYNPTKIYFGKESLNNLEDELKNYGDNVLLVYGKSAIKKIGLYDKVIEILKNANKNVFEVSGVMPNPTYKKMMEGANAIRENNIDLILAVGGGSVIDCAKGMSAAAYFDGDAYKEYYLDYKPVKTKITPIGTILTMVGTGSEMNAGSVITNEDLKLKHGRVYGPEMNPKFSILNPELTYSLSEYQMKSGIFDCFSHLMETYFSDDGDNVSDYILEGLMRSLISCSKKAFENPLDYEARSNVMWTATIALNTLPGCAKKQDWQVHSIEHQLGAYTDCAHGMGLAAISIPYYRWIYKYGIHQFAKFATNVWNINPENKTEEELAKEGVEALVNYIQESGMVTNIYDLGATEEMLPLIANSTDLGGGFKDVTPKIILQILQDCFQKPCKSLVKVYKNKKV